MVLPYGEIGSRILDYAVQLYTNGTVTDTGFSYTGKGNPAALILATTLAVSLWILRKRRK